MMGEQLPICSNEAKHFAFMCLGVPTKLAGMAICKRLG